MKYPRMMDFHSVPRVLLITPKCSAGYYLAPPLGLYRLKDNLVDNGCEADIWDQDLEEESYYLELVRQGRYQVIGYSVSHYHMEEDLECIWKLRDLCKSQGHTVLFLAGGHEATMNPEQWLRHGVDFIITGFAEEAIVQLCRNISEFSLKADYETLARGVDGHAYMSETDAMVLSPRSALSSDEFYKFSFKHLFHASIPFDRYWKQVRARSGVARFNKSKFVAENIRIFSTNHCVRGCGFCSSQSFINLSQESNCGYMYISAGQLYELVEYYVNTLGAKGFMISDDNFFVGTKDGRQRAYDFCKMLIASKKNGLIPQEVIFSNQARIDDYIQRVPNLERTVINHEMISLLLAAGFNTQAIGVETFSDRLMLMPSVRKVGYSAETAIQVLDALLDQGLVPQINIILGIPETTVEEMMHTIRISAEYIRKGCQVSVTPLMMSFPGSPIYHNPLYTKSYTTWENPQTGNKVDIAAHYEVFDEEVNRLMKKFPDAHSRVIQGMLDRSPWGQGLIPKFIVALSSFIAIAGLLNKTEFVDELQGIAGNIFSRTDAA